MRAVDLPFAGGAAPPADPLDGRDFSPRRRAGHGSSPRRCSRTTAPGAPPRALIAAVRRAGETFLQPTAHQHLLGADPTPPGVDPFDPASVTAYVRRTLGPLLHPTAHDPPQGVCGGSSSSVHSGSVSTAADAAAGSEAAAAEAAERAAAAAAVLPEDISAQMQRMAGERDEARRRAEQLRASLAEQQLLLQRVAREREAARAGARGTPHRGSTPAGESECDESSRLCELLTEAQQLRAAASRQADAAFAEEQAARRRLHEMEDSLSALRRRALPSWAPSAADDGPPPLSPPRPASTRQAALGVPLPFPPPDPPPAAPPAVAAPAPEPSAAPAAAATAAAPEVSSAPAAAAVAVQAAAPGPLAAAAGSSGTPWSRSRRPAPGGVQELRRSVREYIRLRSTRAPTDPPPDASPADLWRLVVALSEDSDQEEGGPLSSSAPV
eukprot:TRINITY_DN14262_c0_g1_i1.p1 TRINITY_DN14262_c0_g1~~TRINITY_DN14262_c0_g1_i1.p1  ORF type:complete len:498 (+),score=91.97 TRINITY_DN14262_c0_g1_i1:177-1496(+)